MNANTPMRDNEDSRFARSLELVIGVLILPIALIVHRRTFRRMNRDWQAGHRP